MGARHRSGRVAVGDRPSGDGRSPEPQAEEETAQDHRPTRIPALLRAHRSSIVLAAVRGAAPPTKRVYLRNASARQKNGRGTTRHSMDFDTRLSLPIGWIVSARRRTRARSP